MTGYEPMPPSFKCSICGQTTSNEWPNNAQPVENGRCCNDCNTNVVIPTRLANMQAFVDKKRAFMWVHAIHPYCIGYPGVVAELFFSSEDAFRKCLGREPDPDDRLVPVTVPIDFDNWDFIPNDY